MSSEGQSQNTGGAKNGIAVLRWIERAGNRLPDPGTLFVILLFIVLILSQIGHSYGWNVQSEIVREGQLVSETVRPRPLLTSDGVYWLISSMIKNFVEFPPLGIVLVGMMGVGVCERVGLIDALLKVMVRVTPKNVLTPTVVFIGVMSSIGSDSGYVVLPPIVAALFASVGRSPVVGIAAVFAGIAGGFGANLLITGGDAVLAGLTTTAAQLVEPGYQVAATSNWYFSMASVGLLTITGWLVTRFLVEPNYRNRAPELGGPVLLRDTAPNFQMTAGESSGLVAAGITFAIVLAIVLSGILIPGAPLYGMGRAATVGAPATSDSLRWVNSIVPILFFCFVLPGIAFGITTGKIRSEKDVFKIMAASVATLAPIIVLAFFASQFISAFAYSNLGRMLAIVGGNWLSGANLPTPLILSQFVLIVAGMDFVMSSMTAKYAVLSPVFVPMFMKAGISPELTQASYRIADSTSNVITPVNAYLVIILACIQRYIPKAGLGTLISLMLPYSLVFLIVWIGMLVLWIQMGWPLGPDAPLVYPNR